MLKYIKLLKYLFYKKYPAEITFFITAGCNFRCQHCFNIKNISDSDKTKELTAKEINSITKTIPPFVRLSLSGGEPFLRKDLVDICCLFYKNCHVKFITIPTNASLTNKIINDVVAISKKCPNLHLHVSLSLDALDNKRDEITQSKNTFNKLIITARKLKEVKNQYKNISVGVITTQVFSNENELDKIYDFAINKLKVDNFGFNVARTNFKDNDNIGANLEIYKKFTKRLINSSRTSGLKLPLSSLLISKRNYIFNLVYKINTTRKYQIPCYSGRLRVVINETGDVYPCETLQYCNNKDNYLMGNLRKYDLNFQKLFFSPRAQIIKNNIKKTKCFCAHECDLETNILFNPFILPKLLLMSFKKIIKTK